MSQDTTNVVTDSESVDGAIVPDSSAEVITVETTKRKRGATPKVDYETPEGAPIPSFPFPEDWPTLTIGHSRIDESDFAVRKDYLKYVIWYCGEIMAKRLADVKLKESFQRLVKKQHEASSSIEMIEAMGIDDDDAAKQDAAGSAGASMEALIAAGIPIEQFIAQWQQLQAAKES